LDGELVEIGGVVSLNPPYDYSDRAVVGYWGAKYVTALGLRDKIGAN